MAKCRQGFLKQTYQALCLICLLLVNTNALAGNAAFNTQLAMGDIGAIKVSESGTPDAASQVKWVELTKQQQAVLAPLSKEWDTLRPWQREKMLDIARDYPKMDAEKKMRIQTRLKLWSRMTPYERENARKRYEKFHSLSDVEKEALRQRWKAHQALPEAEREKLRKDSNEVIYDPSLD